MISKMFMNSDEIQKHAIVSDSPLSAGAVLVLLQEVFCGSTVAVWVLLPKAQIVKFGGFFFSSNVLKGLSVQT